MVAKKPPLAAPLITAKAASGARVVDDGHTAKMLNAVRKRDKVRAFRGPILSDRNPQRILPMADEKLNPARMEAPVLEERPMERLYSGRKKGATKRGKVAIAPAAKIRRKLEFLKSRLEGQVLAKRLAGLQLIEWEDVPFYKR